MPKEPIQIQYGKYIGPSPNRPLNAEAALNEIVEDSTAWIRKYEETWFGVSDKESDSRFQQGLTPAGVLQTGERVRDPSLALAIDATLRLAKFAKAAHRELVELRDEKDKPAKPTKRKTAKRSNRK